MKIRTILLAGAVALCAPALANAQNGGMLGPVTDPEFAAVSEAFDAAVTELTTLADGGNVTACRLLGIMYSQGIVTGQDLDQAQSYLTCAAEGGDALGNHYLGLHYLYGWGVDPDHDTAASYFQAAADAGLPHAAAELMQLQ